MKKLPLSRLLGQTAVVWLLTWMLLWSCVTACSRQPEQAQPCTGKELQALRYLYERAARQVIDSGACDHAERVELCPGYMAVEVQFRLAAKGMCTR